MIFYVNSWFSLKYCGSNTVEVSSPLLSSMSAVRGTEPVYLRRVDMVCYNSVSTPKLVVTISNEAGQKEDEETHQERESARPIQRRPQSSTPTGYDSVS